MKLIIPDLVSPSYFPAIAAVEFGCFAERGLDIELELHYPVTSAYTKLRTGETDFVAGASHAIFHGAPDAGGLRWLAALSHNTYWFLVVRADLGLVRNASLDALKGLKIGAAPGPDEGFIQMLADAGVDPAAVEVAPVPGMAGTGVSFGVTAVEALKAGLIDGFWANGMGAEVATRSGVGTVVIDARRGDGPKELASYTFACLSTTTRLEQENPEAVRAVVEGLTDAQRKLQTDPESSRSVARKHFPAMETDLTPVLIERDAPYYTSAISEGEALGVLAFAKERGLTDGSLGYDDVVSHVARDLWTAGT